MKQLKGMKKIGESSSPERSKAAGFTTTGGGGSGAIDEESPINLLLFSNMKKS